MGLETKDKEMMECGVLNLLIGPGATDTTTRCYKPSRGNDGGDKVKREGKKKKRCAGADAEPVETPTPGIVFWGKNDETLAGDRNATWNGLIQDLGMSSVTY